MGCFEPSVSTGSVANRLRALAQAMDIGRGRTVPIDPAKNFLVFVGSGTTKLIASASGGREQIVAFHFPGDLVSVPVNAWHSYRLSALVQTEILAFPAEDFLGIAVSEPLLQAELLRRTLTALHRCRDKAVGLGRKNAQERLASFLVGMADRIGLVEQGSCTLELSMSRRDIGDSLGLTIETVSRQFSELRLIGLIETRGRSHVLLRDLSALAERAGHV